MALPNLPKLLHGVDDYYTIRKTLALSRLDMLRKPRAH
jgi:hypothetical protein